MKKFLTMLFAAIMSVTCLFGLVACGGDDEKVLNVYTNAGFAPYEYISTKGEVVGVDIDVMNAIGEELGYKIVINDIKFNKILDEVQASELAVGAAGMTKTDERDEIAIASISYATSVQYVIVPKGAFSASDLVDGKLDLAKLEKLSKKVIGYQEGTTGDFMVNDAITGTTDENDAHVTGELEGKGVTSNGYANAIIASQDIGSSVGAVVIDKLPAQSIVSANSSKLECFEVNAEPESYVLYFNKNATELVASVNVVLQKLIDEGKITEFTLNHSNNA